MKNNLLIIITISIISSSLLFAIEKGRLRGQILDESTETPLIAANIMIEGTSLGTAADDQGQFTIDHIPAGKYNIRIMMMGYETRIISNIIINPNRTNWQTIQLKPTVLEGEGITVTSGFFYEAKDAVVSSRSMNYEEIRMDPGSIEDIQRVMQALPAVVSGSDQENEIIVRGGMPGENLFVMDNIEIPNPNHFAHQGVGGGPINMINSQFVRQVDFYAGAFPARYGDKASSVMDISLRDGNRSRRTGHFYLGMSGAGLMVEGPMNSGKGSYILSARKSFLDLVISDIGLTAVPRYYSLQGKLSYDINPANKLILNGIYGDDSITIENEEEDDGWSRGAENVRARYHQYAVGLTWRRLLCRKGYTKITLSQVLNYFNEYVWDSRNLPVYDNNSTETERMLRAECTYQPLKTLEFNFGSQIKSIPYDLNQWADADTIFQYDYDPQGPTWTNENTFITYPVWERYFYGSTFKTAGFAQVKWNPHQRITTTLGLRFDYFDYTRKQALDPRIGFSYALTANTHLNLAVGQHSQSPAYVALTAHPLNNDLDYKRTRQIILGLEKLFREDIRGTIEIYYKDYNQVPVNLAQTTEDPFDGSQGRLVNKGEGYAKGIELFLQKKSSHGYHFTTSYSYSISKAVDPRYDWEFNWDYDYRHVFTFISGWTFDLYHKQWYQDIQQKFLFKMFEWLLPLGDQVEIAVRWRYLGGRPYSDFTYLPEYRTWRLMPGAPINSLRYPAYHRLDFRLDRRYMFSGWNLVTYLDIMNIYARENIWIYTHKSDGTKGDVLQFQVFPVGGITIEF